MTPACSRARWSVGICDILPRGGSAAALPSCVSSGSLPGAGRRIARPGRFRCSWGPYARARVGPRNLRIFLCLLFVCSEFTAADNRRRC